MYSKQTMNTSAEYIAQRSNPKNVVDNSVAELYKKEKKRAKNEGLSHLYNNDYKPASFKRAC